MRRRYRRTTDLRGYFSIGVLMLALTLLGAATGFLPLALAGAIGLLLTLLTYGWLVQGWRYRPNKATVRGGKPSPSRTQSAPISAIRSKVPNSPRQPATYNQPVTSPGVASLMQLSGVEFEHFVGESIFRKLGYSVDYTPITGDGGIDLILHRQGEITAVQCKRYAKPVAIEEVYAFNGALHKGGYERGYFITTSRFSAQTREWVKGTHIALIDGDRLREWLGYVGVQGL